MSERLNTVDRATLGVWRALHAWSWGVVALFAGVLIHIALGVLMRSMVGSWAGSTPVVVQLAVRVVGTFAIGSVIGWIAAKHLEVRPWITAFVVGAVYAFFALTLFDQILGLPFRTTIEHIEDGTSGGTFISIGMGRASVGIRTAYAAITCATAVVAAVIARRLQKRAKPLCGCPGGAGKRPSR